MTIRRYASRDWDSLLLLALLAGGAALWWRTVGDPFVDSARDLYAAQQMASGRAVYRDLCYLYGPLPPGVLAIVFSIFGASVAVEKSFNLLILAVVVLGLHRSLLKLSSRFGAVAASVIFILMFGLGQFAPLRNYNFLTPYTNAASYGFIFGLCVVGCLIRFIQTRSAKWAMAAGAAAGLSFLTKPEMCLVSLLTLCLGLIIAAFARSMRWKQLAIDSLLAATGALLTVFLALLLFSIKTPWPDLWDGVIAGYRMAMDPRIHQMRFFADVLGVRTLKLSYRQLLEVFSAYCQLLAPAFLLAMLLCSKLGNRWPVALLALGVMCWIVVMIPTPQSWTDVGRGIPIACAVIIVLLAVHFTAACRGKQERTIPAMRLIFAIFAMAMLSRTILDVRLYHYGFAASAAATILIVAALASWVPDTINRASRSGELFRYASLGAILAVVGVHLHIASLIAANQTVDLPGGFTSNEPNGAMLLAAVNDLTARARPGDTLAALPEACWVNFVTAMPNPTPYELLNPVGVIRAGGEGPILAAYQAAPPPWIMLVHHDTTPFGAARFGIDFAQNLKRWIDDNYEQVQLFGQPPLKTRAFGIALLKHRDSASPAPATSIAGQ